MANLAHALSDEPQEPASIQQADGPATPDSPPTPESKKSTEAPEHWGTVISRENDEEIKARLALGPGPRTRHPAYVEVSSCSITATTTFPRPRLFAVSAE